MNQFMYALLVSGEPTQPLMNAGRVQQMRPELTTTVESLTNAQLAEVGVARVRVPAIPQDGYRYLQGAIERDENGWFTPWVQQDTPERDRMLAVRSRDTRKARNQLLTETDWTQLADAPLSEEQKAAWSQYRQDLRNLTAQATFPWQVQWPTKP
jgi:hypothetical protein